MNAPKLTQTALLEVLVAEIESFKNTKKEYDKILKETSVNLQRLEELYNKPISVDTHDMRQEHQRIQATLHRALYIPQWLGISFLCLVIALVLSVSFNYKQYLKIKDQRDLIEYAKLYIEDLEKQLPKSKSKK